jgi:hypothetical protein
MSFLPSTVLSKAFDKVSPSKEVQAFLTPREQPKMDYNDPATCPYCRKPMVRSTIRSMAGIMEPVYVCHDDRAVGVVPDGDVTLGG